jgi:flagellar biosynthesis/type III secretory pathway protein FliH
MAKQSATASVINKNMEPKDVEALESQFRRWVKSAAKLGMVQVLEDSNALAGEVVR